MTLTVIKQLKLLTVTSAEWYVMLNYLHGFSFVNSCVN